MICCGSDRSTPYCPMCGARMEHPLSDLYAFIDCRNYFHHDPTPEQWRRWRHALAKILEIDPDVTMDSKPQDPTRKSDVPSRIIGYDSEGHQHSTARPESDYWVVHVNDVGEFTQDSPSDVIEFMKRRGAARVDMINLSDEPASTEL